ncbi:dpf-6 [Symbiodinium sp. CCMP2592]|nr:dpf-6 [Symbiodinium sp. CCMP2592]
MDRQATARWLPMPENSGVRSLKFWRHPSFEWQNQVKWELRRILDELHDKAVDQKQILRDEKHQWEEHFKVLGSSYEETILPSAFAFRQRYKREPPLHLVDAFQAETHGLLGLIVSHAVCRRKAADQERGKLVLRSFLSTVLGMEDPILDLDLLTAGEEVIAAAGQCEVNSRALETDALDAVSALLIKCFRNRSTCCAAGPLFKSMVFKLVRHVASIAAVLGTDDALQGDTAVRGSSKRRLDTDRKSALINLALEDRKAKSVKVLCQGRKEKGAENSDRWVAEEASAYRWAAAATFADVQNLSLAYDVSRVGQPKEDTLVVAGLAVDRNTGAWFLPQASQSLSCLWSSGKSDMQHPVLKSNLQDVPSGSAAGLEARLATCTDDSVNRALLQEQLEEQQAEQQSRSRDELKLEYTANKYFALSLDKCLQKTIQIGLSYFLPNNRDLLLLPGETLVLKELSPEDRLEGVAPLRAVARDEGSIGWVCSLWLDNCVQLRGSTIEDAYHRWPGNDFKNALVHSGLWLNVCERAALYNAATAPYENHGNFSLLAESAKQYFELRDHTCPLFALLYDPICSELGLSLLERGTEEHMKRVFESIRTSRVFQQKMDRVKLGRWASWFRATESWQGQKMPALLVFLWMGIQRKWWTSLAELPILSLREEDVFREKAEAASSSCQGPQYRAEVRDIAAEFTGGERKKSVAESNAELKRLKTSSKHMLHLCANILGNPFANTLTELTLVVCQPLCRFIDGMRTTCSTPWGSEDFHISLANGSLQNAVSETWSVLSNNCLLQSAGFLETHNCGKRAAAELENDNKLAEILFETAAEIIAQFTLSGMTWTHRYPGFFVSLLDTNAEQQKRNMAVPEGSDAFLWTPSLPNTSFVRNDAFGI